MATTPSKPTKTVTINYTDPAPGAVPQLQILNDVAGNVGEIQFKGRTGNFAATNNLAWDNNSQTLNIRGNVRMTGTIVGNLIGNPNFLKLIGGNVGDVLTTDGNSNLSWQPIGEIGYGNSEVANYLPTFTGNLKAGNANLGNVVTANYFVGNGSLLTGLSTVAYTGNYNDLANKPELFDGAYSSLTGAPSLVTNLDSLTDVTITSATTGQVLKYNGTTWVNDTDNTGGGATNEITNTDEFNTYSVSVSTNGVVTMNTARGGIEFGAQPEEGAPQHLHIMRPAGQEGSTDLYFGDDYNYVKMPSSSYSQQGVEIGSSLNQGTVSVWRFGTDGDLVLPDGSQQSTAWTGSVAAANVTDLATVATSGSYNDLTNTPNIPSLGALTVTGNEIQGSTFGGTGTSYTKTVDVNSNNYSTGGGSLGFLNFGADGEVENVKAGWTVTFASGETRIVANDAYQPIGTYWNISFNNAYTWGPGDVMPVTFSSPDYVAGSDPQVTLTAGPESWTFDDNGSITFPDATVQTTAYVPANNVTRVSETWTVTPGTSNYSFTVPGNGVYQLWVRANIPNGIISYIATAAVTNSNVPVLGTQYAWNYIDGGSPIIFTSLPAQFVGTEGQISTASPAVGTTANTFVFGIANSTAGNVIVEYGYTKIS